MGTSNDKRDLTRIADNEIDKAFAERTHSDNDELRRLETDFDVIQANFLDPTTPLPTKLNEKLERWKWARLIKEEDPSIRSKRHLVKSLMNKFAISESTAYQDVLNMERLFATVDNIDTDFEWTFLYERCLKELQVASDLGSKGIRVVPALLKQLTELMKMKSDKSETLEPTVVHIHLMDNPELVGGRRIPNLKEKVYAQIAKAKAEAERRFEDVNFDELS